jgi:hypothetical protein
MKTLQKVPLEFVEVEFIPPYNSTIQKNMKQQTTFALAVAVSKHLYQSKKANGIWQLTTVKQQ